MKKLALVLSLVVAIFVLSACNVQRTYANCDTPDGTQACWNAEEEMFRWEAGATITIGVDNNTLGAAIVEKWNTDYPALVDKLVFRNYGSANGDNSGVQGIQTQQDEAPDVALVIDNEVTGKFGSLFPLHSYFADLGKEQTHEVFDIINTSGTYFLPALFDGMSFAWNKTMLTQMGINLTDSNSDNLPDAIDTWEEIFAIANAWTNLAARPTFTYTKADNTVVNKKILEVFPISLDEVWSGYSSVTAGGWQLFAGGDMTDPEFDDPKFKVGLEFIQAFAATKMSVDDTGAKKNADAMGWRWDQFLDGEYPFGLVGTWVDVDGKEADNNLDFKFSKMPTYQGVQLSPLLKTKGFVLNGFTANPSAASEVLRWLYTKPVLQVVVDNSSYPAALQEDALITPVIESENKQEMINAFAFSYMEPSKSLPLAPTQRAMNVYYSIQIGSFYRAVWNGTKTPAVAQSDIVAAANAWLELNNVAPE